MILLWWSKSGRPARSSKAHSLSTSTAISPNSTSESDATSQSESQTCTTCSSPPQQRQQQQQQQQSAPLLTLPIELIQQITSYLSSPTAASLGLSCRYLCYAIGTHHLHTYLSSAKSKIEKRKNIEIVERAFPSHWYCAWCDKFHRQFKEGEGGPKMFGEEKRRDCAEFNSYLHDEGRFVVGFHHVRLAVNRWMWGDEYGISLSNFLYEREYVTKVVKRQVPTSLMCEAKIVAGHFVLHSEYKIEILQSMAQNRNLLSALWKTLPQVLVGHRDSKDGHTGLKASLENALMRNWKYGVQLCSVCATDYTVSSSLDFFSSSRYSGGASATPPIIIKIQTWRNLGTGRSPFNTSWRAHGELGRSRPGFSGDIMRLTNFSPGDIKKAYEIQKGIRHVAGTPGAGPRPANPYQQGEAAERFVAANCTREVIKSRDQTMTVDRREKGERQIENVFREGREEEFSSRVVAEAPSYTTRWRWTGNEINNRDSSRCRSRRPLTQLEVRQSTSGRGVIGG